MIRASFRTALAALVIVGLVAVAVGARAETVQRGGRFDPPVPTEQVRQAIDRGVDFLVATQKPDGSWGTPAPVLFLDIYSPAPGSHYAYGMASSALALSALIEVGGDRPGVAEAIRKGAAYLVEHHQVKRVNRRVLYNNWAHAYALEAFLRLMDRETDEAKRAEYGRAAKEAVDLLERFQYVDGGWGYYDFSVGSKTPAHGQANSFTTATVLVALSRAREHGIQVPKRLLREGAQLVRACRLPGGAYAYSYSTYYGVPRGVNKVEGSLARTPACLAALLAAGDDVPQKRVVRAMDLLEEKGHFLQIARKYPRPHESWFQNSGYFCFYGYYYASELLDRLPASRREVHSRRIADHLVPLQEEDGSFWDYQLFGFHKFYGTGYVLMTLGRCLEARRDEPVALGKVGATTGS